MQKRHLKLVVDNTTKQCNLSLIQKISKWLRKTGIISIPTKLEKKRFIQSYLTNIYAEYQLTTGEVGLFPASAAINQVKILEENNQIDKYYRIIKRKMA
jgi:hypothetical protein|nr:MAG TPA: hypothetical protein [Caudoviricetes sp.]